MNLEHILSKLNPNMREEWAQVESIGELQNKARELGLELTVENAQTLFTALTSAGELLSDDVVGDVTGGAIPKPPPWPFNSKETFKGVPKL